MATCFIFTKYLQENGCLISRFNDEGDPDLEARFYSFAEIRDLQTDYKTILVYSSQQASLLDLELPWLAESKARAAIPFALEDRITQSIELLHFAFDKKHYSDGIYKIVVLEKEPLARLIETFDNNSIEFDSISLDWYALNSNESLFIEETAIINSPDFKGALSPELAIAFPAVFQGCTNYLFQDSIVHFELPNQQKIPEASYLWISRRLLNANLLNLCQGEFQQGKSTMQIKKAYRYLGGMAALWLVALLATNAFKLHMVNSELAKVDQQIATIYKQFFPEAKQVINPRFRINQLLGNSLESAQSNFWNLINKLADGIRTMNVTIEQFRFQNKTLVVSLICSDFASLEKLEDKLKQSGLNVSQTQAANKDQQVVATLELK